MNGNPLLEFFNNNDGRLIHKWMHYVEEDGIEVFIGDQGDRRFLQELAASLGPIQILIDHGGHTMRQQITTFEEMYLSVSTPGVYLVEDLRTSYWKKWGGGIRKRSSFIEYSKRLIDNLNAWHIYRKKTGWHFGGRISVNDFTRSTYSMTYYDSVLVLEKKKIDEPTVRKTGSKSL